MSESEQRRKMNPHQLLAEVREHALDAMQAAEYPLARALSEAAEGLSDWIATNQLEHRLKSAGARGVLGPWFDPARLRDTPLIGQGPTGDGDADLVAAATPERIAAERYQGLYTVYDGPCICRAEPASCWHVHPADRQPRRATEECAGAGMTCGRPRPCPDHDRAPARGGEVDMRPRPACRDNLEHAYGPFDAGVEKCYHCGHIRPNSLTTPPPGSPDVQDAPTQRVGFACPDCPGFVPDSLYHLAQHAEQVHGVPAQRRDDESE